MDGEQTAEKVKRKTEADNGLETYSSVVGFHFVIPFRCLFSERFTVIGKKHPFYVRFLVENLTAQLVISYCPVVAVVLQGTAAHFESCRYLPIRQKAFIAE